MEHTKAQKRMLICAAFLSLGALGGVLTFARLSEPALEKIGSWVHRFLMVNPLMQIPLTALVVPLLLLISGASAFGTVFVFCLLMISGFAIGAGETAALRLHFLPLVTGAFLLLDSLCVLQIAVCMLRRASVLRAQVRRGGQVRADYRFDVASAAAAFFVLVLAAFIFAYYLLNV